MYIHLPSAHSPPCLGGGSEASWTFVGSSWDASRGLLGDCFEASWESFWSLWGPLLGFLGPLGDSWGPLGASWKPLWAEVSDSRFALTLLGLSSGPLGVLLGRFKVLLDLLGFSWDRVMAEWTPFSFSLVVFWVLLGLLRVLLRRCWSKMGPFFHLPRFLSALFRSSHQPCAFMALHVL